MSTTPLSNIQEIIERSIFETIRQELVDKGYLPDITLFPDTIAGEQGYITAMGAIVTSKGFCIDIFNESSNFDKGQKNNPRIVIKSGSFLAGELGGNPTEYYIDKGDHYTSKITPPQTSNFYINIHLVAKSIEQVRVLNSILTLCLPKRKYLKWYTDPTSTFFIMNINYFELDDNNIGINEKVYVYEIPDCWDMEDITVRENIAKMVEITVNPMLQKYIDGNIYYTSDPLVVT